MILSNANLVCFRSFACQLTVWNIAFLVFDILPRFQTLHEVIVKVVYFVPSLFDTLIDFRCHRIALTADIEKAFLQVSIKESDRDFYAFCGLIVLKETILLLCSIAFVGFLLD